MTKDRGESPFCKCGCGEKTYWNGGNQKWAAYKYGHKPKGNPADAPLCECRCGQTVTWSKKRCEWHTYVAGHYSGSQEGRERMSATVRRLWKEPGYLKMQREKSRNLWKDPEIAEKIRAGLRKKWKDPDFANKMTESLRARWQDPEYVEHMRILQSRAEYREILSNRAVEMWQNEELRESHRVRLKNLWQNPEYVEKMKKVNLESREIQRRKSLDKWQDPDYVARVLDGNGRNPNKPEAVFDAITPEGIRYTGDGSWWRKITLRLPNGEDVEKYKNPDFKVSGENKVIEIYGDYWHKDDIPEDMIEAYKGAGIECLILWEHEIYEDTEEVLERVAAFVGEESWQMTLPVSEEVITGNGTTG